MTRSLPIVVCLDGGLGNQLFQLAKGLNLKSTTGRKVILGAWRLRKSNGWEDYARPEELSGTDSPLEIRMGAPGPDFVIRRLPRQCLWRDGAARPVGRSTVVVSGYFQSLASVQSVSHLLKPYFTSVRATTPVDLLDGPYISVHSRLGDYLTVDSVAKTHGVTDPRWLMAQAIELRNSFRQRLTIRVFTDSPTLFSQIVDRDPSYRGEYSFSQATGAWQVLFEMAHGVALLMSNSTLSWWAGWLQSSHPDFREHPLAPPMIPFPWFRSPSDHDKDLRHPDWSVLKREILELE